MPAKQVVGISYEDGDAAPIVMLKAAGTAAEIMIRDAHVEHAVPVVRDPALVNQLYRVPMNTAVGRELFPVMATLLAHVLNVDRSTAETRNE